MSSIEICGFYSITSDREYEESASALRYFIEPKLPIDLNEGIHDFRVKSQFFEKMGHVLTFLVNHKREFLNQKYSTPNGGALIPSARYITYRGILRKIICSMTAPRAWNILATKYKGNIYLCQWFSQEELEIQLNRTPKLDVICNYWPMFEHHCFSEHPDMSKIGEAGTQFFCVFKRDLVKRKFLFSAEMDGTDSKTPLNLQNPREWKPNQFIAVRLNCELNTEKRKLKFERAKMHNQWALNYLTGIETVRVGFRNDSGTLKKIQSYSIDEIEKFWKRYLRDSTGGLKFLDSFLSKVETDLKDIDCPYTTIKYSFDQNRKNLSSTKHEGRSEYSHLPEWYLEEMK